MFQLTHDKRFSFFTNQPNQFLLTEFTCFYHVTANFADSSNGISQESRDRKLFEESSLISHLSHVQKKVVCTEQSFLQIDQPFAIQWEYVTLSQPRTLDTASEYLIPSLPDLQSFSTMKTQACTLASCRLNRQTETSNEHMNWSRPPSDDVVLFAGARSWIKSSMNWSMSICRNHWHDIAESQFSGVSSREENLH